MYYVALILMLAHFSTISIIIIRDEIRKNKKVYNFFGITCINQNIEKVYGPYS